jgi:hypothetical protein
VCVSFTWQADGLVFNDGSLVCTALQACAAGAVQQRNEMTR